MAQHLRVTHCDSLWLLYSPGKGKKDFSVSIDQDPSSAFCTKHLVGKGIEPEECGVRLAWQHGSWTFSALLVMESPSSPVPFKRPADGTHHCVVNSEESFQVYVCCVHVATYCSPAAVGPLIVYLGARAANNNRILGCASQQWHSLFSEECI
jgi:hypothetical protein